MQKERSFSCIRISTVNTVNYKREFERINKFLDKLVLIVPSSSSIPARFSKFEKNLKKISSLHKKCTIPKEKIKYLQEESEFLNKKIMESILIANEMNKSMEIEVILQNINSIIDQVLKFPPRVLKTKKEFKIQHSNIKSFLSSIETHIKRSQNLVAISLISTLKRDFLHKYDSYFQNSQISIEEKESFPAKCRFYLNRIIALLEMTEKRLEFPKEINSINKQVSELFKQSEKQNDTEKRSVSKPRSISQPNIGLIHRINTKKVLGNKMHVTKEKNRMTANLPIAQSISTISKTSKGKKSASTCNSPVIKDSPIMKKLKEALIEELSDTDKSDSFDNTPAIVIPHDIINMYRRTTETVLEILQNFPELNELKDHVTSINNEIQKNETDPSLWDIAKTNEMLSNISTKVQESVEEVYMKLLHFSQSLKENANSLNKESKNYVEIQEVIKRVNKYKRDDAINGTIEEKEKITENIENYKILKEKYKELAKQLAKEKGINRNYDEKKEERKNYISQLKKNHHKLSLSLEKGDDSELIRGIKKQKEMIEKIDKNQ